MAKSKTVIIKYGAKSVVRFVDYNILKNWLDTKRKRSGWA